MKYTLRFPPNYNPPPLPGRDEWLTALRSRAYEQGKLYLKDATGATPKYCCLGVLCEVQQVPNHKEAGIVFFDSNETGLSTYNPLREHLSGNGQLPAGVTVTLIRPGQNDVCARTLAGCNDHGLPFNDIADIIGQVWSDFPKNW